VTVVDAHYYLLEQVTSHVLSELPPLPNIGQQVSSSTNFNHKYYVLGSLKGFIKLYYVVVPSSAQNIELLHDLAFGGFLSHELLIYGLESNELSGQSMNGQVHFAESAFPHHFAYFIKFTLSLRLLTYLCEARSYPALQPCNNASFRG
jgi:hypothetical protein